MSGDGPRPADHVDVQRPMHNVDQMGAPIGELAAGVVPEPAEVRAGAIRIPRNFGRRAQPRIPIKRRGRIGVRWRADSRWVVVLVIPAAREAHPPDLAIFNQLPCSLEMAARALLL